MQAPGVEGDIARIVGMYKNRSALVRRARRDQNRKNWAFFHGQQDWSHKQDGQSRIFLPDLPIALQQMSAAIENELVNFSNWFSVETLGGLSIFDGDTLRLLMQHCLDRLWKPGNEVETAIKFPSLLANAILLGLIESEITFKIYGVDGERCVYMLESSDPEHPAGMLQGAEEPTPDEELNPPPGRTYERLTQTIRRAFLRTFRLGIDLVPFEDSFPDPSPLNLYHIHSVVRHVSELRNNPDYDPDIVDAIAHHSSQMEFERDKARRAGNSFAYDQARDPNQVVVDECWGDIVDPSTGEYLERNCLTTVCGGRVLRPPTPNPFWHGFRPIVRCPLVETPLSPVHDAMMDRAVPVAEAENEVTSLLIDGGIAAVWGTRQVHREYLENPTSIAKGIPAAATLILKKGVPLGAKVIERCDEGTQVPSYGVEVANRLGRARQTATATSDLRLGNMPARQVKATEVVEAQDGGDSLYQNMGVRTEEKLVEPTLQIGWLTMWQQMDDFSAPEIVQILGAERALILQQLSAEERFYLMANNVKFKVRGLRNLLQRINDFRKLTTVMTTIATNPMLAMAWNMKYDTTRLLEKYVRSVNIDPTEIEYREGEGPVVDPALLAQANMGGGFAGGGAGSPGMPIAPGEGEAEGGFAPPNPTGFRGAQV